MLLQPAEEFPGNGGHIAPSGTTCPMKAVTLQDGSVVRLRPIRPEDEPELIAFHGRLSRETAYRRFLSVMPRLPSDLAHLLANVDYDRRMAIVAIGPEEQIIAVARYKYDEAAGEAEIALVVQDQWQGKGLGTLLFGELLAYAETRGIPRFRAYVLWDNQRMLDMLTRFTEILERRTEFGVVSLLFAPRPRTEPAAA